VEDLSQRSGLTLKEQGFDHRFVFWFFVKGVNDGSISIAYLSDLAKGFLPRGLFERLVGRAISWSLDTSGSFQSDSFDLHRNSCILYVGSQEFRITQKLDGHCIIVDIKGKSPVGVHARLCEMLTKLLAECMKALTFTTLLPYYTGDETDKSDDVAMNVSLDAVHYVSENNRALNYTLGGRRNPLDKDEISRRFPAWLRKQLEHYDAFISYQRDCGEDVRCLV
jgi:hypothetical protein